jgi:hypothetical protein
VSVGNSGRVVIEIDPSLKRELYEALARNGKTMKDWFTENAQSFIEGQMQMPFDPQVRFRSDQG